MIYFILLLLVTWGEIALGCKAYAFQTFSVGQVLTSSQMNATEVNIRDHVHGVAGVVAITGTILTIIDAAGDGIIGTAADTAGRLAIGTAGQFPAVNAGATALAYQSMASQADQETATSILAPVTPGRQQFHPSAAKFWAIVAADGIIGTSYNLTSVTDGGTGQMTFTIATDFTNVNWIPFGLPEADADIVFRVQHTSVSAGAAQLQVKDFAGTFTDPTRFVLGGFGDLP